LFDSERPLEVNSTLVAYAGGIALIISGVVIIRFGDRQVGDKRREGVITRTFSMPALNVKVLKWIIGLLCIWFGTAVVFTRGNL
jgi:hypothetical protein